MNGKLSVVSLILGMGALGACAQGKQDPKVWLTSADRTALVALQPEASHFKKTNGAATGTVILVDDTKRYQSMEGFGFALTGGSAELLMRMSPARRAVLLQEIFGRGPGDAGVSYLRLSIGSSDMNERVFTYDDLAAGETDATLEKFSLGPDLLDVVPIVQEILRIAPRVTILASPWSAPSWMKTNGVPKAGSLKPEFYAAYAQYFVRYVQTMASKGIPVHAVTMQNEPRNANNTPSMIMTAPEQAAFLGDDLGPALRKAHLPTDVILYDHNCDDPAYPLTVLADRKASQYTSGSGFHLYEGTMDALTKVRDAYPDKALYFTEQMVIQPDKTHPLRIANSVSDLMVAAPRNWSRTVLLWNLAADAKDGPHTPDGGCPVCQGAITLEGDAVTRNLAFYTVAQVAPFVPPGSVRIASDTSVAGVLPNVAYATPDHKIVLVVTNPGKTTVPFQVSFHGQAFATSLGEGDVATYVFGEAPSSSSR